MNLICLLMVKSPNSIENFHMKSQVNIVKKNSEKKDRRQMKPSLNGVIFSIEV